jgi:hypothetical protein
MTTFTRFDPPEGRAFNFQATFDGGTYKLRAWWNVFGQRWFLECKTGNDEPIFTVPLVSSPDTGDINLIAAYFAASSLVFRQTGLTFEVSP